MLTWLGIFSSEGGEEGAGGEGDDDESGQGNGEGGGLVCGRRAKERQRALVWVLQ